MTRRRIVILILIVVVLIAPVWFGIQILRIMYYQNNYDRIKPGPTTFRLEPSVVRRGESFTLVGEFTRTYDAYLFEPGIGGKPVNVIGVGQTLWTLNAKGEDVLLTADEAIAQTKLIKPSELGLQNTNATADFRTQFAAALPSVPGIMLQRTFEGLQQTGGYFIESIGCPIGFAPPSGPPPRSLTSQDEFQVLPTTPTGIYTVRIAPGAYCNGLPPDTHTLTLTVTE